MELVYYVFEDGTKTTEYNKANSLVKEKGKYQVCYKESTSDNAVEILDKFRKEING